MSEEPNVLVGEILKRLLDRLVEVDEKLESLAELMGYRWYTGSTQGRWEKHTEEERFESNFKGGNHG